MKTLFPKKILQAITVKRPKKVYGKNDVFPYGSWKGQRLSIVANFDPQEVEKWISKNKINITAELQQLLNYNKYLAQ